MNIPYCFSRSDVSASWWAMDLVCLEHTKNPMIEEVGFPSMKAVGAIWSYCDVCVHVQLEKGTLHMFISAGFWLQEPWGIICRVASAVEDCTWRLAVATGCGSLEWAREKIGKLWLNCSWSTVLDCIVFYELLVIVSPNKMSKFSSPVTGWASEGLFK